MRDNTATPEAAEAWAAAEAYAPSRLERAQDRGFVDEPPSTLECPAWIAETIAANSARIERMWAERGQG